VEERWDVTGGGETVHFAFASEIYDAGPGAADYCVPYFVEEFRRELRYRVVGVFVHFWGTQCEGR